MRPPLAKRSGAWPFLLLALFVGTAALLVPRADLPSSYHHFADHRSLLGIPNFGDVASNVLFFLSGLWGLVFLAGSKSVAGSFIDPKERWSYLLVFVGLLLTAFGSAYYHLAPDNARLVWDRLPMTLVFMPLVAAQIGERVGVKLGLWLLPVLTLLGISSVLQWRSTVLQGVGDVRFYGAVQLYAVLALFTALTLQPLYTRNSDLLFVVGLYALAKLFETADRQIFSLGDIVSGHTLKHLAAGLAGFWILRMLQKRQPVQNQLAR